MFSLARFSAPPCSLSSKTRASLTWRSLSFKPLNRKISFTLTYAGAGESLCWRKKNFFRLYLNSLQNANTRCDYIVNDEASIVLVISSFDALLGSVRL